MLVSLLHNPRAGDGEPSGSKIKQRLEEAGHQVTYRSVKDKGFEALFDAPADVMVVAGGDGTVSKAAIRCAERGMPLAILAVGTANNISRTLGISSDLSELLKSLSRNSRLRFDLGCARGPWDEASFIEGAGAGLLPLMLATRARNKKSGISDAIDRLGSLVGGRQLMVDLLKHSHGNEIELIADGEDLSGSYLLVEAMNIRTAGPALPLAPYADPGDGLLDLVWVRSDRRDPLARFLAESELDHPAEDFIERRVVREVTLRGAGTFFHYDDHPWPQLKTGTTATDEIVEVRLSICAQLEVFAPGA